MTLLSAKFCNFPVALIIQHSFQQQAERSNNFSVDILRMPYGIKIWPSPLFITLWVLGHGVYKTIDFHIDLHILRMTGAMANLPPPADCACSSRSYRFKSTRIVQKINSVRLKITKLYAKNPLKHQYLSFTHM